MYPDRPLQACLQKGWTEYKKTKSARRRSLSFFHIVARAPPARRVGNARGQIPLAQSENRSHRGWQTQASPERKSFAHQIITLRPTEHLCCAIPMVAIHVRAPNPKIKHPEPTPAAPSILERKKTPEISTYALVKSNSTRDSDS